MLLSEKMAEQWEYILKKDSFWGNVFMLDRLQE